jgi:hypothetical protein
MAFPALSMNQENTTNISQTMKPKTILTLLLLVTYGYADPEPGKQSPAPAAPPEKAAPAAPPAAPMFITVGGEVRKPGQLQINETAQLYAVIQSAGGPTEFGSMRKVKILRNGASTEYDLEDDTQKTTPVMPNDVIEIPKKNLIGR